MNEYSKEYLQILTRFLKEEKMYHNRNVLLLEATHKGRFSTPWPSCFEFENPNVQTRWRVAIKPYMTKIFNTLVEETKIKITEEQTDNYITRMVNGSVIGTLHMVFKSKPEIFSLNDTLGKEDWMCIFFDIKIKTYE